MQSKPIPVALPDQGPAMTRPLAVVLAELARRVLEGLPEETNGEAA